MLADGEEWIAFQWIAGHGDGIFLVRPDGTGQRQLVTDLDGSEIQPDWSPDGERIAFIHVTPADRNELWVVGANGSDAARLYSCDVPCNTITYPDWAPDGTAIYYGIDANATVGPPTTFGVGRFDLASEEASWVLTREDGMSAEQPRISPDGQRVVYTRFNEPEGSAIFISDLNGGPETRLTEWELWGAHPDWSIEDSIVFNSYDLGVFQDTTEPANLYTVAWMEATCGSSRHLGTTTRAARSRAGRRMAPASSSPRLMGAASDSGTWHSSTPMALAFASSRPNPSMRRTRNCGPCRRIDSVACVAHTREAIDHTTLAWRPYRSVRAQRGESGQSSSHVRPFPGVPCG